MENQLKLNTPLEISEIDFRVQSINKGGYATILAYKDARVDMNRLDAVYGVEGWQKKYEVINNHLFCSVAVWSEKLSQWIWKQDVGTESMTEKEKGEASDAFKRACFNLGIGRELYDYPIIQIKLFSDEFTTTQYNGKDVVKATFNLKIKEWVWISNFLNGKLTYLSCKDNNGKERFTFDINQKSNQSQALVPKPVQAPKPSEPQITISAQELGELKRLLDECSAVEHIKEIWDDIDDSFKSLPAIKDLFSKRKQQIL